MPEDIDDELKRALIKSSEDRWKWRDFAVRVAEGNDKLKVLRIAAQELLSDRKE